MTDELKLQDNDQIAVIGAGPAGSLFAYSLLRLARQRQRQLQVTLYDPRNFSQTGPAGCNKCAGVINSSFYQRLKHIGIDLDQEKNLVQSRLRGYLWGARESCWQLDVTRQWGPIRTVYRGHPPYGCPPDNATFDTCLLSRAVAQGAQYQCGRVCRLELPDQPDKLVRLTIHNEQGEKEQQAALVVGAFGLNLPLMRHIEELGVGYRRPRYIRAGQVGLLRREDAPHQPSDEYIRVFNLRHERIRQLILTPKGGYATLTILGAADLNANDFQLVKETPELKYILEAGWQWPEHACRCLPYLLQRSARNFFSDRLVLIGDAACCRYYKNGLDSALRTAMLAAETAIFHGLDRRSFHKWYFPQVWREIIHDNLFGRLLLSLHYQITLHPRWLDLWIRTRAQMRRPPVIQRYDDILRDLLTGNRPYRNVFYRMVKVNMMLVIALHLTRILVQQLRQKTSQMIKHFFSRGKKSVVDNHYYSNSAAPHLAGRRSMVLASGSRVSIIGGGPAGASCAIKLQQLARQHNLNLEVTVHEAKDFAGGAATFHPSDVPYDDKRINQCIGVLSPPIHEIITRQLGIAFPDHLVQKYIIGYQLHGQNRTITLDEVYGCSFALRRITFDAYMMEQVLRHGCRLKLAPVNRIAHTGSGFDVITDDGVTHADVLVGAFGTDQQAADIFTRRFGYRQPEYMQTIITKRHPPAEFLRNFGLRIHAFLPALKAVEFAAITPKYNHLSINIAGRRINADIMQEFLSLRQVAELLPREYDEKGHETYFPGRFPTGPAGNIFADRMVLIGDASGMLRPFKGKGINSAILSGIAAAKVLVHRGCSGPIFQRYYYPVFRQIIDDIWYARTARLLTNLLAKFGGMDVILALAQEAPALRRALAEAVAGACTYRTILHRLTEERILWRSGSSLLRLASQKLAFDID